ncbi:MAG: adenine specific DNA methyltransferase, partial [bacterium]
EQFQKYSEKQPIAGQLPLRGVIEVKPTTDETLVIAESSQVSRYWQKYRQVLVTNYRDFVLIGQDNNGNAIKLETYQLAENEKSFWANANNPYKVAQTHSSRFVEYLKRVMLHAAPIASPVDVAWFLASYARDAKDRIDQQSNLPALANLRTALEQALGIHFEGEKGERFFRSTLVQTLFYGIFSAWVLWSKEHSLTDRQAKFDWHTAAWKLRVPMIRALFEQIATPSKLKPLGLIEVLNWTGAVLNRVVREDFFAKFEEENAVQYFYEPFLQAFDPELRKDLGVWYTPKEIVKYMVSRVDTVLREELDIEDGLADERVFVLDPSCGTGAYLVEVLRCINNTLQAKGTDALGSYDLKKAAINRIFGFEILPAPFVVAHLQLGLLLQQLGVSLSDEQDERVGVYLTNALTGWEPAKEPKTQLLFPEMEEERDRAEDVKRDKPILVILGNPPYNAFAGISPIEEQGLVEPYKKGLITEWGIKKFNLDDLYVRFFRLAERRIAEKSGKGIVCYISNFSFLSDPSFVVMRQRFTNEFDKLWFDCMNGDSRETGKLTPEGKPDPSIFSTEYNREGIKLGTVVTLMVRKDKRALQPSILFRHFWGSSKRAEL